MSRPVLSRILPFLGKVHRSRALPDANDQSPVFLIGFHRGKTTFVQRVLNCSSEVVVWGEHGGILRHYRLALERFEQIPIDKIDHRKVTGGPSPNDWSALANPMETEDYLNHMRTHVSAMFNVGPDIRWGFKEIHYQEVKDAEFLIRLYPKCRILFLKRNPAEMFLSQYFVHWNTGERGKGLDKFSREFAASYRRTIGNFERVNDRFTNAMIVDVDKLSSGKGQFRVLTEFLGLSISSFDQAALDSVFSTPVGSSFGKGEKRKGIEVSPERVAEARKAIAAALETAKEGSSDPA